jgi:hypothetical protein
MTWPDELPQVKRVKIDNRGFVTARVLRMLGQMPALEHVAIRGGFVFFTLRVYLILRGQWV